MNDLANLNDRIAANFASSSPRILASLEQFEQAGQAFITALAVSFQPIVEAMNAFVVTPEYHQMVTALRETRHNRDDRRALLVEGMYDEADNG